MNLNKAILIGNLTRDPEVRALPSGGSVCSFSIATNRVYKKADGTKAEQTDFHNIVVFGKQADTAGQFLKKGQSVLIEGRIQTRSWEKDGAKQFRTEVVADQVTFGPRLSGDGEKEPRPGKRDMHEASAEGDAIEYPQEDINPDDIPF